MGVPGEEKRPVPRNIARNDDQDFPTSENNVNLNV
jgi:hypothetical protein